MHQTNDETLDCIPPGVLVPDFPLVVLYEFILLLLQSVRLFVREEEEEESSVAKSDKRRNGTCQWEQYFCSDDESDARTRGRAYYVNRETNETRWVEPEQFETFQLELDVDLFRRDGVTRRDFADFETFAVFDAVRKRSRVQGVGGRERRFV